MESKQHVDIITFTMTIQKATSPSIILGDAHVYASMCVPLHAYIMQTEIQTHTLHNHTNPISYKRKIFQQKNYETSIA